jgi:DNA-binding response OmpR family regulator
MSGRVLLVERDDLGRGMMDRVLSAAGWVTDGVSRADDARDALDREEYRLAVVDELAGTGSALDEVRTMRRRWPRLPLVVTGSVLSSPVLLELMRLGVLAALPKPFTPAELRELVAEVSRRTAPGEAEAREYAVAIAAAREALGGGRFESAATHLDRALNVAPLDTEAISLLAVLAEVRGDDRRALQLHRAAMVLGDDESSPSPDPREGVARVMAYAGARPTERIEHGVTAFFPGEDLALDEAPAGRHVVVITVGVCHRCDALVHLRDSGERAFAVSLGDDSPETLAHVLDKIGAAHVVVTAAARAHLDLERIAALRAVGAPR